MVKRGYFKLIVTTNFDQLMERALMDAGVLYQVIFHESDISNMMPLQHSSCTLLKVHGDYIDGRLRNTVVELESYGAWRALLKRVFAEYGLIVCGWAAQWEPELCRLMSPIRKPRFPTFWSWRGKLETKAEDVIKARRAVSMQIADADKFFSELKENLEFLEGRLLGPVSKIILLERLKRAISGDDKIVIYDTVQRCCTETCAALSTIGDCDPIETETIKKMDEALDALICLICTGLRFSEKYDDLWCESLERLLDAISTTKAVSCSHYPAIRGVYAAAMTCLSANKIETLNRILTSSERGGKLLNSISEDFISLQDVFLSNAAIGQLSAHLFSTLRPTFEQLVPFDKKYSQYFDQFECLHIAIYSENIPLFFAPFGRLGANGLVDRIKQEFSASGPFKADTFINGGSTAFEQGMRRLADLIGKKKAK